MKYTNNLLYKLNEYGKNGLRPFHMPGHKRHQEMTPIDAYMLDITEIDGFDDLHHAEECILDAMKRASAIYKTRETFFLVNGCTGGILAAVSAVCKRGDKILLARNSHKSAYNAMYINELTPIYLGTQQTTCVNPDEVSAALKENPDIRCVFITSPTYEGYISDIRKIAAVTHKHGAVLIVDEAHGAHLPFGDIFPDSALHLGTDIVIHGIHKTLPTLTQTALLHVNSDRVDIDEIKRHLSIFQTSSPSYLLMGAIDYCMDFLETDGDIYYKKYCKNLDSLYKKLAYLKNLHVLPYGETREASKIVICHENGAALYRYLREKYNLQPEMSQPGYVIMMTSVWDDEKDYKKLVTALTEIDDYLSKYDLPTNNYIDNMPTYTSAKPGDIAKDIVYVYPPGIPIISAGEIYTQEIIDNITYYMKNGYKIKTNIGNIQVNKKEK